MADEMHICQLSYKRIRNLGNYESATLEVTIALNEGESPDNALAMARAWVEDKLSIKTPQPNAGGARK